MRRYKLTIRVAALTLVSLVAAPSVMIAQVVPRHNRAADPVGPYLPPAYATNQHPPQPHATRGNAPVVESLPVVTNPPTVPNPPVVTYPLPEPRATYSQGGYYPPQTYPGGHSPGASYAHSCFAANDAPSDPLPNGTLPSHAGPGEYIPAPYPDGGRGTSTCPVPGCLVDEGCIRLPCGNQWICWGPQRFFVSAGVIMLQRSRPDSAVLVTDSLAPGGNTLVDAAQYGFGTQGGFDFAVRFSGPRWGVDWRFFNIDHWTASFGPTQSAGGAVAQFANPVGFNTFPTNFSGGYQSQLNCMDLNIRRNLTPGFALLGGVRYVELEEQNQALEFDAGAGLNTAVINVGTINRLYGVQFGGDGTIWRFGERFRLDGVLKSGVYLGSLLSSAALFQTAGPGLVTTTSETHTAFVGELGLIPAYQVTEHITVRAGYQMFWIEGVALASEQYQNIDLQNGTSTINHSGSPFYHGAVASIQMVW